MKYVVPEIGIELFYNSKVYSPEYSSIDTIMIVDKLIKDGGDPTISVIDVGCGTGVIGLGVKKLNPEAHVTMCDIEDEAVKVATRNAKENGLKVKVFKHSLLPKGNYHIVTANLPTYSDEDMTQELHGPRSSYYAGDPLSLYRELLRASRWHCKALVVECQAKYQKEFMQVVEKEGFDCVLRTEFSFGLFPRPKILARL